MNVNNREACRKNDCTFQQEESHAEKEKNLMQTKYVYCRVLWD